MPYDLIGADFAVGSDDLDYMSGADDDLMSLVSGDDDYDTSGEEIIGARRQPHFRVRMPPGFNPRRVQVAQRQPHRNRRYPIGVASSSTIAAAASSNITVQPQVLFRLERLLVPSDIAGAFTIDDIKIGKNSQLATTGSIPARTFQENAEGIPLRLDTCQVSQLITLSVTNISGAALTFRAALIGTAVE